MNATAQPSKAHHELMEGVTQTHFMQGLTHAEGNVKEWEALEGELSIETIEVRLNALPLPKWGEEKQEQEFKEGYQSYIDNLKVRRNADA